jgi:hypothetical protein
MIPLPKKYKNKFRNASTDFCDMASGPCACGAWHSLKNWPQEIIDKIIKEAGGKFDRLAEIQNSLV